MSLFRHLLKKRRRRLFLPSNTNASTAPYDIGTTEGGASFLLALSDLADAFLAEAEDRIGVFVDWRPGFTSRGTTENPRSRGEYALDLLTLGVLRREYGELANATSGQTRRRLRELWQIRSSDLEKKAAADRERGQIFLDLLGQMGSEPPRERPPDDVRLVQWLEATGEFVQEAAHLRPWLEDRTSPWPRHELSDATAALAGWFEARAKAMLGRWTSGVEAFRARVLADNEPREDLFLITRSERLYHLNMLGAEIMNRAFRAGWSRRPRKVVLLPGCMRAKGDGTCQARREGLDITCTHCDPSCEVAAVDRMGQALGFRVFVVPHASSFSAWLEHWSREPDTALVATACPLHLLPGGYEIRSLGIDAQCVLLDYSGCRRHWDPVGKSTRIDKKRLLELVGRPFDPC